MKGVKGVKVLKLCLYTRARTRARTGEGCEGCEGLSGQCARGCRRKGFNPAQPYTLQPYQQVRAALVAFAALAVIAAALIWLALDIARTTGP
jgi:hypothetical protein